MSAIFHTADQSQIEVSPSWSFDEQVRDVLLWLSQSANAECIHGGALQLAFNCRLDDYVAVQGEIVPLELLQHLAERQVDLRLAIYPRPPHG